MTAQPPMQDDPLLAMVALWQGAWGRFGEALRLSSQREARFFQATTGEKEEAERLLRAAQKVRDDISGKLELITEAIFKLDAHSIAGAVAKLDVAIRYCAPSEDCRDEPWSYLRSVHADLERLHEI